jgi:hypothetical protein
LLIRLSSRHSASEEGILHVTYGARTALGTVLGAVNARCGARFVRRATYASTYGLGIFAFEFRHRIFKRGDNTEKHYNTEPCAFLLCFSRCLCLFCSAVSACGVTALRGRTVPVRGSYVSRTVLYGAVRCRTVLYGVLRRLVCSLARVSRGVRTEPSPYATYCVARLTTYVDINPVDFRRGRLCVVASVLRFVKVARCTHPCGSFDTPVG